ALASVHGVAGIAAHAFIRHLAPESRRLLGILATEILFPLRTAGFEELGEIGVVIDGQIALHAGVVFSAILGASEIMLAEHGRREPDLRIAAWDDVVLHAHIRYEEIVQHVLAGHGELHRSVDGYVNIVDGP